MSDDDLDRVRRLSHLLDSAVRVPGTSYRVGLDPLVGLVPGVGDAASLLLSGYVLLVAARLGVPRETLVRMALNLAVDALVGSVPLAGDVFDAAWKANERNLALLEARLADPDGRREDRHRLLLVLAGLLSALLAVAGLAVLVALLVGRLLASSGLA